MAQVKNLLLGLQRDGLNRIEYYPFDPVFNEYGEPRSADLVCWIDALGHIEPEKLENFLLELSSNTINLEFFLFI